MNKKIVFFVVVVCIAITLALVIGDRRYQTKSTYTEFLQQVQSGQVAKATIAVAESGADPVNYILKNGARVQTIVPGDYKDTLAAMQSEKVDVEIEGVSSQRWQMLINAVPFFLLLGFWFFMLRQLRNKPGSRPRTV